jgi:hypothetical protein
MATSLVSLPSEDLAELPTLARADPRPGGVGDQIEVGLPVVEIGNFGRVAGKAIAEATGEKTPS